MANSQTTEIKVGIALSAAERKLIDDMPELTEIVAAVQKTPTRKVQLSVVQMDELADALSVKANHTEGRVLQRRLDTFARKIDRLTGRHLSAQLKSKTGSVHPR